MHRWAIPKLVCAASFYFLFLFAYSKSDFWPVSFLRVSYYGPNCMTIMRPRPEIIAAKKSHNPLYTNGPPA